MIGALIAIKLNPRFYCTHSYYNTVQTSKKLRIAVFKCILPQELILNENQQKGVTYFYKIYLEESNAQKLQFYKQICN